MSEGNITPKQKEILEYIKDQILTRGFPPAVREICEAVNLKSTSSVHSHLETLEKNGYIRRDPTKPRAIEILDDNFNLTRREMVNIPIIGRVAAGEPLLAEQNIEDYFPIPVEYMPNKQTFMLQVQGESMINEFAPDFSESMSSWLTNCNSLPTAASKLVIYPVISPNSTFTSIPAGISADASSFDTAALISAKLSSS